ncbi:MAG: hypothetical protein NVS4B11_09090 [Ktedonobacteraceae bacterium]
MRFRIPLEFSVGILAAPTLLLLLPPLHLPIYGIFVFWGGTFLLGSPNAEGVKKMVPPAILGTIFGLVTVYLFGLFDTLIGGGVAGATITNIIILFVVVTILVYFARIPMFAAIAAAFCSFAVFVAVVFGLPAIQGFGPSGAAGSLTSLIGFWLAATIVCVLGPFFAWASVALTNPSGAPASEKAVEAEATRTN